MYGIGCLGGLDLDTVNGACNLDFGTVPRCLPDACLAFTSLATLVLAISRPAPCASPGPAFDCRGIASGSVGWSNRPGGAAFNGGDRNGGAFTSGGGRVASSKGFSCNPGHSTCSDAGCDHGSEDDAPCLAVVSPPCNRLGGNGGGGLRVLAKMHFATASGCATPSSYQSGVGILIRSCAGSHRDSLLAPVSVRGGPNPSIVVRCE